MSIATLMNHYVEAQQLDHLDGIKETGIPGVRFYRAPHSSARQPLLYQSGIIIIGQGRKLIHLGEHSVGYGAGDYLVLGVPLPLECEAFTDGDKPILGLVIDIEPAVLHKLVDLIEQQTTANDCLNTPSRGVHSVALDPAMELSLERLLTAMACPLDSAVLGQHLLEEIIYRVLMGPQGNTLFGLAQQDGHYARIAKALNRVHSDYAAPITIVHLADEANMSVSAFHRAFRQVTLESPLQYLKKVRLVKAKELILLERKRANDAARLVGYTSPSQFSREFKRHFNRSPSTMRA
ncbi:AraC family transcriptional regulator [Corallincola luteus]|uniref:AraC family transcriptional regulator n=1 Tax=Corallincola luteus TaxID=1775177 RepID=A0ABY2AH78_9GAMM|nr:AraC family transcriptional regulator [Corallincola luteus]TCI01953.1 AraC family transcriptional regulator [Corallincola luteus]